MSLAARIVKRFQKETFRIMEEEPERLAEIKGISLRKAREIGSQVAEKRDMRQAMIFLQQYGISLNMAIKIYQKIYGVIKENPYQLADDIQGIGFKIADEIAARVGIRADSDFRIRSGILYCLLSAASEGHTYLPKDELTDKTAHLLGVDVSLIQKHFMDLAIEKKIFIKGDHIYGAAYYRMETVVAEKLRRLNVRCREAGEGLRERIVRIAKQNEMEPDEMQMTAVEEAVKNGLTVITGGPGTGKTTTINTMIRYFESEGLEIFLAAPTGRAAKRMSEATGCEARTIHRMLELNGGIEGNAGFSRNEDCPLEADVIIIDEMSMVDISLMHALLKAVVPGTRLILVGDVNQLPSVGPGSVLKDMISSGAFSVVELIKIFRQAAKSDIILNAHKINAGEEVSLDNKSMDFFFLKRYDADVIISVVLQLISRKLPKYVEATPFDIQVLTPMRKGLLGVERLNGILQQYLNPPSKDKAEREHGGTVFREGDKVMQIRNNYDILWKNDNGQEGEGVFNGDIGVIRSIEKEAITVDFDGKVVEYSPDMLGELEPAYAVTVHKAQGSEYRAVILAALEGAPFLMTRGVLYTAVTRARELFIVVGDPAAVAGMVNNNRQTRRYSGLRARLAEE